MVLPLSVLVGLVARQTVPVTGSCTVLPLPLQLQSCTAVDRASAVAGARFFHKLYILMKETRASDCATHTSVCFHEFIVTRL